MARNVVSAEATVDAPADRVYLYLADMRDHHSRFLPPAFSDFQVESGGVGPARLRDSSRRPAAALATTG